MHSQQRRNTLANRMRGSASRYAWGMAVQRVGSGAVVVGLPPLDRRPPPPAADVAGTTAAKLERLEAVLFLAGEPLSSRKLADLADLADGTEARTLLRQLSESLRRRGSALQPVEIAGGFQLLTRPEIAEWLSRLHGAPEGVGLSTPALETLSVVAYRQPVARADVEAIRGVQCGEMLRVLMQRDLLRIVGRSEELGRPFQYGTTRKFLQVFGLRRLDEMPPIDDTRGVLPDRNSDVQEQDPPQLAVGELAKE